MRCTFSRPDGSTCGANSLKGKRLCFHHSPEVAAERKQARIKGGRERAKPRAVLPFATADVNITSAADVLLLLSQTISQVRKGELDSKIANAIAVLSNTLLRALETADLEQQVSDLEARLKLVN